MTFLSEMKQVCLNSFDMKANMTTDTGPKRPQSFFCFLEISANLFPIKKACLTGKVGNDVNMGRDGAN